MPRKALDHEGRHATLSNDDGDRTRTPPPTSSRHAGRGSWSGAPWNTISCILPFYIGGEISQTYFHLTGTYPEKDSVPACLLYPFFSRSPDLHTFSGCFLLFLRLPLPNFSHLLQRPPLPELTLGIYEEKCKNPASEFPK